MPPIRKNTMSNKRINMEALLDPRFLFIVVTAVITLVGWFVRLEMKTVQNSTEMTTVKSEIATISKDHEAHRMNQDIHFNLRISQQVEQGNERRFVTIERQLGQINDKLDKMAERKI